MPRRDSYLAVVALLLCACFLGVLVAMAGGAFLGNPVILDAGVSLWIATGMVAGVLRARVARLELAEAPPAPATEADTETLPDGQTPAMEPPSLRWLQTVTAITGGALFVAALSHDLVIATPSLPATLAWLSVCLLAAWLAAMVAEYLGTTDADELPEGAGLARGARVLAWVLVAAAAAAALERIHALPIVHALHAVASVIIVIVVADLATRRSFPATLPPRFPTNLTIFSILGRRHNPLGSAMDLAQEQLGIDLRSTWALDVVRRSTGPLLVGSLVVAWLSTSMTVVAVDEQGLVERFGVPLPQVTLDPGLHFHWPWPVERLVLVPVQQLQTLHVGHEEDANAGPEDILWAREHAKNEYTLLLGNGRDLVSVDATVQFRIADPRAWQYACQNPAQTLSAICYRAVMKTTVNRTLSDVLSQNLALVTEQMRAMVQKDADALGLGVEVVAFNVGGMHPPVPVAVDYQAVVSAKLIGTTSIIEAQAYRNSVLPEAESARLSAAQAAHASTAETLSQARGDAGAFRALDVAFRADAGGFIFRRRLETLDDLLPERSFTVLDARIQRDGGELWLMK